MRTLLSTRIIATVLGCAALSGIATAADKAAADRPQTSPAPTIMLVPVEISTPALQSGCWAQMYDERDFKGEMLTVTGPMQIDSTDKAGGRALRKALDSLVIGPKATLTVYENKMFKDKTVQFGPNSKEAGLVKKLGFRGRIESMKLECTA